MAFKFKFEQTGVAKDPEAIREAIKESLRAMAKKLKEIGASIELNATIDH